MPTSALWRFGELSTERSTDQIGKYTQSRLSTGTARSCAIQAQHNNNIEASVVPVPEPPRVPLRARMGVHIKYLFGTGGGGSFYIGSEGGNPSLFSTAGTAFPVIGNTGSGGHNARERRRKQVFLPVTDRVSVFLHAGDINAEGASWLEIA